MSVGRRVGMANRQVKAFLGQVDEPVREVEFESNVRKCCKEVRQQRGDVLAAEGDRRRHSDHPARRARENDHLPEVTSTIAP